MLLLLLFPYLLPVVAIHAFAVAVDVAVGVAVVTALGVVAVVQVEQ